MRILLGDRHFHSGDVRFFLDKTGSFPTFVYLMGSSDAFREHSSSLGNLDVLLEMCGYHTIYGDYNFYLEAYGGVSERVSSGDWEEVFV